MEEVHRRTSTHYSSLENMREQLPEGRTRSPPISQQYPLSGVLVRQRLIKGGKEKCSKTEEEDCGRNLTWGDGPLSQTALPYWENLLWEKD